MGATPPNELAETFERLKKEVFLLQFHCDIYNQLFLSQERLQILDCCAPEVFYCFQISLEDEMIMLLSRITDPRGKEGEERLSFDRLHKLIEQNGDRDLAKKLRDAIKQIRKTRASIKDWRDKRLAHRDLKTAMAAGPMLDPVTFAMVQTAIRHLHEYMSIFEQHYEADTEFSYETALPIRTAGDGLMSILQKGLRLQALMDKGQVPYE